MLRQEKKKTSANSTVFTHEKFANRSRPSFSRKAAAATGRLENFEFMRFSAFFCPRLNFPLCNRSTCFVPNEARKRKTSSVYIRMCQRVKASIRERGFLEFFISWLVCFWNFWMIHGNKFLPNVQYIYYWSCWDSFQSLYTRIIWHYIWVHHPISSIRLFSLLSLHLNLQKKILKFKRSSSDICYKNKKSPRTLLHFYSHRRRRNLSWIKRYILYLKGYTLYVWVYCVQHI